MYLKDMAVGAKAKITKLTRGNNNHYRQKLMSMGLIPGTLIVVSRIAPLGDPVEITVRGYSLSLRKHEAKIVELEEVEA